MVKSNYSPGDNADDETLLRVDEALTKFAAENPRKAELAEALGISESTAKRA
jgi:hypothetical protein